MIGRDTVDTLTRRYIYNTSSDHFNTIIIPMNIISCFSSSCNIDLCISPLSNIDTFVMAENFIILGL